MAKDIKTYNAPDAFAATNPDVLLCRRELGHLSHVPVEDQRPGEEHMFGKVLKAMCGTRAVAQSWQRKCYETARKHDFMPGDVSPCHLYHSE